MSARSADVLVVGVGTMGSMALWRLASRGASVMGIEQFAPGHDRGSGHGESRMIRTAYYEGPEYVPLVRSAFAGWRRLEAETGARLLTMTGGLMIGEPESELVAGTLRSAREHDLEHELLDARLAARRFPQHRLAPREVAVWEAEAGKLRPEHAILAAVSAARARGASIVQGERVTSVEPGPTSVTVRAGDRVFRAAHVVVTAGAWLGTLLPELRLPLRVERQVMAWFPARVPERFGPDRFPVFIHERDGVQLYGLPGLDGSTVKLGIHHHGPVVDPDRRGDDATDEEVARVRELMLECLDGLEPRPARAAVCMYTNTPDLHFAVGHSPASSCMTVLGGFSGHGFKFGPIMGDIAADLALEGRTEHPIGGFDPRRFAP